MATSVDPTKAGSSFFAPVASQRTNLGLGIADRPVFANFKGVFAVGSLPAGVAGDRAVVTDALTPTFGAAVAAGGAVITPVYYAAAWMVG